MKYNVYFEGRDLPIGVEADCIRDIFDMRQNSDCFVNSLKVIAIVPSKPLDEESKQVLDALDSLKELMDLVKEGE